MDFSLIKKSLQKSPGWSGGIDGIASFVPIIEENPEPLLRIEYHFPWGADFVSNGNSALSRPFLRVLEKEKLPGKVTYVFHTDGKVYYVLGSFVYTEKHVIFFPGFLDRKVTSFYEKNFQTAGTDAHVNHFTLDEDWKTWHISFDEKRTKGTKVKTLPTQKVDDSSFLWLVVRVRSLTSLEVCPKKLQIIQKGPLRKLKRIAQIIKESREQAIFQGTLVNDELERDFFWQFEIFISNRNNSDYYPELPLNKQGNNDVTINDEREETPSRIHQVFLAGLNGSIFIRVSKVIGTINTPIQIISGNELSYKID